MSRSVGRQNLCISGIALDVWSRQTPCDLFLRQCKVIVDVKAVVKSWVVQDIRIKLDMNDEKEDRDLEQRTGVRIVFRCSFRTGREIVLNFLKFRFSLACLG